MSVLCSTGCAEQRLRDVLNSLGKYQDSALFRQQWGERQREGERVAERDRKEREKGRILIPEAKKVVYINSPSSLTITCLFN